MENGDKMDLEKITVILKGEFIGIDTVIDEIITTIKPWYLFPEFLESPVIINLWGLTGVGKTSLVKRLSTLLGFENHSYHINASNGSQVNSAFSKSSSANNGKQAIFMLDEFQKMCSKCSSANDKSIIWDLLDSGFIADDSRFRGIRNSEISNLLDELANLKYIDVKSNSGLIEMIDLTDRKEKIIYNQINKISNTRAKEEPILIVKPIYYELIRKIGNYSCEAEVMNILLDMNLDETIDFIKTLEELEGKQRSLDFSKSLIFILGNLDKAYNMSSDLNPDMDADKFHEESTKISITRIKIELQRLFKNEQIARLGNNHIIYPAFNEESFRKLIDVKLTDVVDRIKLNTGVIAVFDSSVIDTIYKEGVYPAQGTRPLFSTIDRLIKSKLANVYYEIKNSENPVETIFFRSFEPYLLIEFFSANNTEQSLKIKLDLKLEEVKKEPNLDTRAVVAVHESGHAVLSIALNNSIPNAIYSTSTGFNGGMTIMNNRRGLFSKNMLINKLAVSFGGIVAEKLIFGENNITLGSRRDLMGATRLISDTLMYEGFSDGIKGEYKDNKYSVGLHSSEIENQIKDYLKEAEILAEQALIENEELLVKLSEYLLNEDREIKKEKISEFIDKYYKLTTEQVIEKSKEFSYKAILDNRISKISQLELVG